MYVIGLRGAGQEMTGSFGMGDTLQPYAQGIFDRLPRDGTVAFYSLPYDAAPFARDPQPYFRSVEAGRVLLFDLLLSLEFSCPESRVGLLAYSEGAHVVQRTLPGVFAGLERIRAMLLLGNPVSAGDTDYAGFGSLNVPEEELQRVGGGVLGRTLVPSEIQERTTDFCIQGDTVCDNDECFGEPQPPCQPRPEEVPISADTIALAFGSSPHFDYPSCCIDFSARGELGGEFADRLMDA
ncbi:MAG: cutinase family protein [Pseudonocardiaceae bacterium]